MQTFGLSEAVALGLIDEVRPLSSFGIWDELNKGADTFGDATRETWVAEQAIELLGRCRVPRISLHDVDVGLCPWEAPDKAARDARFTELIACLEQNGVSVHMYTPCLFKHPKVRAGSLTSNSVSVRRASLKKVLEAVDRAAAFGAEYLTLWLGRDGSEVDAVTDSATAFARIAEALTIICAYIRFKGYKLKITLEPKPNEPRGDIFVATVGTALGIISLLSPEDQEMVEVNPELLQHEGMAGLNAYHATGLLIARRKLAFLHLGGQTLLRYDQDHPFLGGNSGVKESFYVMMAVVEHQPDCILEFDCHPFRTEAGPDSREEFVYANLIAAGLLKRKAREFLEIPRVQELRALSASTGFGFTGDLADTGGSCWLQLEADDLNEGQDYDPHAQELDMLVNLHLAGQLVA